MISFILACLWIIAAKVIAMFPTRDHHWRAAYWLMALGVPLLGWIVWQHGVVYALVGLLAGAWVLRWPVYYLWKRVRGPVR
jgi:hypothetical protein